jgi:hypothetical protein
MSVRSVPSLVRRGWLVAVAAMSGVVLAIGLASPAGAVTIEQKVALLTSWTQPTTASSNAWNAARGNQGAYAEYALDWSTDYCSSSPDQPLGFDFRLSCWRHDFGYRNFKAVGQFPANKSRVDSAFYQDMLTKCATYNSFVRPACNSLAWTYYQAVSALGAVALSASQLATAERLKSAGEYAAALSGADDRRPRPSPRPTGP